MRSRPRYRLIVRGAGFYESDSLMLLAWEVIVHRLGHLVSDGRWRD
jgi:hypothetical protein